MRWRPALVLPTFVLIGNQLVGGGRSERSKANRLPGKPDGRPDQRSLGRLRISLGNVGVEALGVITLVGMITITLACTS